MLASSFRIVAGLALAALAAYSPAGAQQPMHGDHAPAGAAAPHTMPEVALGGGWILTGMGQVFPVVTWGGAEGDSPVDGAEALVSQPLVMANLESPGSGLVLRVTPNFEGLTLEDGELTPGGWGEGFIDRRHPHTLLHELMLSWNLWDVAPGLDLSFSGGKGFAPYGTDDPMARPVLKYPTNHHLSQILERWTLNAVALAGPWSVEAGLFGGQEPEGPYDMSNVTPFGNSWSVRVVRRFGEGGAMAVWPWELKASWASVTEEHHGEETTRLANLALRHQRAWPGVGEVYALAEASRSDPEEDDGVWSLLAEGRVAAGAHQPYYRFEWATRPEFEREAATGDGFFRYDHDDHPTGATRWAIHTLGYGFTATDLPVSVRPFVEGQLATVSHERGPVDVAELFGGSTLWAVSLGARVFLGGDPMRMGGYGVLDPMSRMRRSMAGMSGDAHH
ncbi:MAG: hypothetical protein KY453_00725 [Gemmatimonadetes bacterium]|nr:hypothetical protein [Gemmatimonadota bacterium]